MSSYYTPWTWSEPHKRHYSYLMSADNKILDTLWAGPPGSTDTSPNAPASSSHSPGTPYPSYAAGPSTPSTQPTQPAQPAPTTPAAYPHNGDENNDNGRIDSPTQPSWPAVQSAASPNSAQAQPILPVSSPTQSASLVFSLSAQSSSPQTSRATLASLPPDVQANISYLPRRFIQTGADGNIAESLDSRYRRVANPHQQFFFVPGRVFKMLWTEPAGLANPGRTRNSTHFSTVYLGEQAYSEIRRFVVVRNKGTFSQCIPVQTYKGRGATKPGILMQDHGIIHTTIQPPEQMPGENLTKYSIRVHPTALETLEPASRVNYGKAYAVEHNVKVLDIGMVVEGHRYLIKSYFDTAMMGQ